MESIYFSLTNNSTFYSTWKSLNLPENTHNYRFYMFRSSTVLSELVQSLAKVTLLLKHSRKLRRFILCGDVAACRAMAFHYMLPHLNTIYHDVIFLNVLTEV